MWIKSSVIWKYKLSCQSDTYFLNLYTLDFAAIHFLLIIHKAYNCYW